MQVHHLANESKTSLKFSANLNFTFHLLDTSCYLKQPPTCREISTHSGSVLFFLVQNVTWGRCQALAKLLWSGGFCCSMLVCPRDMQKLDLPLQQIVRGPVKFRKLASQVVAAFGVYHPKTTEEVPPLVVGSDQPLVELGPPLVGLDYSHIATLFYIQKEDMKISTTDF